MLRYRRGGRIGLKRTGRRSDDVDPARGFHGDHGNSQNIEADEGGFVSLLLVLGGGICLFFFAFQK